MPKIVSSYPAISNIPNKKILNNNDTLDDSGAYPGHSLPDKASTCPLVRQSSSVPKVPPSEIPSVEKFSGNLSENSCGNVRVSADEGDGNAARGKGATATW